MAVNCVAKRNGQGSQRAVHGRLRILSLRLTAVIASDLPVHRRVKIWEAVFAAGRRTGSLAVSAVKFLLRTSNHSRTSRARTRPPRHPRKITALCGARPAGKFP